MVLDPEYDVSLELRNILVEDLNVLSVHIEQFARAFTAEYLKWKGISNPNVFVHFDAFSQMLALLHTSNKYVCSDCTSWDRAVVPRQLKDNFWRILCPKCDKKRNTRQEKKQSIYTMSSTKQ